MAYEPGKPGRKQKISRAVIDTICDFISKGASYETAAKAAGISRRTLYNWLERAETEGGIYAEFRDRIERQSSQTNVELTELIKKCALENKDWKAAEALLRARLPQEWNRAVVQHNHQHQGEIHHQITAEARIEALIAQLSPEQLYDIVRPALLTGPGDPQPTVIEGSRQEALPALRQVRLPRVPADEVFGEVSASLGGSDLRED
jgi:transposase